MQSFERHTADAILRVIEQVLLEEQMVNDADFRLTPDVRLLTDLRLDSMQMLELITALEEEYGISVDLDELETSTLDGAGSLAVLVAGKLERTEQS